MAQMKTHWKRKALAKYKSITLWYKKKMGFSAASIGTESLYGKRGTRT